MRRLPPPLLSTGAAKLLGGTDQNGRTCWSPLRMAKAAEDVTGWKTSADVKRSGTKRAPAFKSTSKGRGGGVAAPAAGHSNLG